MSKPLADGIVETLRDWLQGQAEGLDSEIEAVYQDAADALSEVLALWVAEDEATGD